MSLPLAPSTSLTAVSAGTTPSSPGLNSGRRLKCTERRFPRLVFGLMGPRDGRIARLMLIIAIVVAEADEALYLFVIFNQSPRAPDVLTVPFVASFIQLMAILVGISLLSSAAVVRLRPALGVGAAAGLLVLGVIGAFSVGAPLFLAGAVVLGVAVRTVSRTPALLSILSAFAAALVVVALMVAGVEVTARVIECPADGSSSGSWSGLVTSGFSWNCVGGQVQFK